MKATEPANALTDAQACQPRRPPSAWPSRSTTVSFSIPASCGFSTATMPVRTAGTPSSRNNYADATTHVLCRAPPSESHVDWAAAISFRRALRRTPARSMSLTSMG
jgi:hypothetical protein